MREWWEETRGPLVALMILAVLIVGYVWSTEIITIGYGPASSPEVETVTHQGPLVGDFL